mgnify:CR=1 FL=1
MGLPRLLPCLTDYVSSLATIEQNGKYIAGFPPVLVLCTLGPSCYIGGFGAPLTTLYKQDQRVLIAQQRSRRLGGWSLHECRRFKASGITGTLPAAWASPGVFPELEELQIEQANLTGSLPPEWAAESAFPSLQQL